MTRITVACLDMAGTTIANDGTLLEAFSAAITEQNLPSATYYGVPTTDVRSSMGQSKIEVFRRILGDEETAQKANDAFENHYAAAVRGGAVAAVPGAEETITAAEGRRPGLPSHGLLPRHQGRDHQQARLGRPDPPGLVPR